LYQLLVIKIEQQIGGEITSFIYLRIYLMEIGGSNTAVSPKCIVVGCKEVAVYGIPFPCCCSRHMIGPPIKKCLYCSNQAMYGNEEDGIVRGCINHHMFTNIDPGKDEVGGLIFWLQSVLLTIAKLRQNGLIKLLASALGVANIIRGKMLSSTRIYHVRDNVGMSTM
jgi:hypothetical protein